MKLVILVMPTALVQVALDRLRALVSLAREWVRVGFDQVVLALAEAAMDLGAADH